MGFKGKTNSLLFLNTGTEHHTYARFVTQYSLKLLIPPRVEVYAHGYKCTSGAGGGGGVLTISTSEGMLGGMTPPPPS